MKKLLLAAVCFAFVARSTSDAQANPLARAFTTFVINQVVALVTQKAVQQDGVKAEDPRLLATQRAMSMVATDYVELGSNGRFMMAANGPTWLSLASVLLGAHLGEIASAKIGKKDVTVSATASGEIVVKREWIEPPPRVIVPAYPGAGMDTAGTNPWVAMAALGAQVYRESSCNEPECAPFPVLGRDPAPYPEGLFFDWFRIYKGSLKAYARGLENVKAYLLAYAETRLRNYKLKVRNLRIEVVSSKITYLTSEDFAFKAYYEFERCKKVSEKQPDGKSHLIEKCSWLDGASEGPLVSFPWVERRVLDTASRKRRDDSVFDSLDDAFRGLSDEEKALELNPTFVANIANSLASKASQRKDYAGVPHSMTSPIRPDDVKTLTDENGKKVTARLADAFSRPMDVSQRFVPVYVTVVPNQPWPGTRTWPDGRPDPRDRRPYDPDSELPPDLQSRDVNVVNTPGVHVVNAVQIDVGPAPNTGEPTLETPPTPSAILSPILSLLPDFKQWRTPSRTAACPRPVFDVFQTRISMDAMCDIAERHRKSIHAAMLAVFLLIAVTVLLAA
ncbi:MULTISPECIES: hypothetical protein [Pandoraea]|uniref:hypothetical protein n=1 Tax=Pandoraea TaxID=93217 RepID=UPI001F5DE7A0|nr:MULTISPECIES: hypothetical protein [Pandoraea]